MPIRNFVALRYMDGFACIGGACEDNCCGQWNISIDQGTHQRLKRAMAKDPAQAALFERTFALLPLGLRNQERFAEIPEAAASSCPMLDGEKLCTIHGKYGPQLLPTICDSYPRRHTIVGGRGELAGEISCPEVARRALLVEGGADVLQVQAAVYGNPRLVRDFEPAAADPYHAQLDEVRGTLYQLFGLGQYPLSSRLYFAYTLAERVNGFFRDDLTTLDPARLAAEIETIETPALRDALHERFRALPSDGPLATSVLAQALAARLLYDRVARMLKLVESVFVEYASTGSGARSSGDGGWTLSPEPLWADYRTRWERLMAAHGERIDRWFKNYCQHYVMYHWYSDSPTLMAYVRTLALKLALIRFVLVAHPLVREAAGKPEAEAGALLDRAIVEVVYTLARSFDHSPAFISALSQTISDAVGPSATVALLKL